MIEWSFSGEWSYYYVNSAPQQRESSDGHVSILERIKTDLILYCYHRSIENKLARIQFKIRINLLDLNFCLSAIIIFAEYN